MLTMKTIMSQIQGGDWFVTIDLKDAYFHIQVIQRHRRSPSVCLWREGLPIQGPALQPGLGTRTFTNAWMLHWPLVGSRASCAELSGRLAHSGSLQGASKSPQRYRSPPHHSLGLRMNAKKSVLLPSQRNRVSGGSFGFHSDAGPFGSCPDIQFYSMSVPLQARPSCHCRYLPQSVRPHGSGLPCVAPRVLYMRPFLLVDERAEVTRHCTSHSPNQGVAQLLSRPLLQWWDPRFSPERGENGCDPPSPYDHDGHINDGLGRPHINRQGGSRSRTLDRLARSLLL